MAIRVLYDMAFILWYSFYCDPNSALCLLGVFMLARSTVSAIWLFKLCYSIDIISMPIARVIHSIYVFKQTIRRHKNYSF